MSGGTASSDATFAYNYGQDTSLGSLSIPAAPHTTDGSTLGLRLWLDNLGNTASAAAVGAITVATTGLTLPTAYTVTADVWGNYIGSTSGIATSGANGTTSAAIGVGTAGTGQQSPNTKTAC